MTGVQETSDSFFKVRENMATSRLCNLAVTGHLMCRQKSLSLLTTAIRFSSSIDTNEYLPRAAYSVATKANGFIFISGQLGTHTDDLTKFVSDDIEGQTEQCLNKIKGIVETSGSSMNKIVKATVLLDDFKHYYVVNKIYSDFFNECGITNDKLPTRTCYECANLPMNAKIEIEAIALE